MLVDKIVPFTSNLAAGLPVPIPTLPNPFTTKELLFVFVCILNAPAALIFEPCAKLSISNAYTPLLNDAAVCFIKVTAPPVSIFNLAAGLDVPIPTLPAAVIRITSDILTAPSKATVWAFPLYHMCVFPPM